MSTRMLSALTLLAACVVTGAIAHSSTPTGFVAHEWGTFTSVQGSNGKQIPWSSYLRADLPTFVYAREHDNGGIRGVKLDPVSAKGVITSYVRMETPVIYFYSEAERDVDVRVRYPNGTLTEWYPRASRAGPYETRNVVANAEAGDSFLEWKGIKVLARELSEPPRLIRESLPESNADHYYTARETDANFIRVSGSHEKERAQHEKVLFYRGVGYSPAPLTVTLDETDRMLSLSTRSSQPLTQLFVMTIQGNTLRYQKVDRLHAGENVTVDLHVTSFKPLAPARERLMNEIANALVAAGLYEKEARAMVNTWRHQWFAEEGTRVLYLLPPAWTDRTLPLEIAPRPDNVARVMVGRAELITHSRSQALRKQVLAYDSGAPEAKGRAVKAVRELAFGRFLAASMQIAFPDPSDEQYGRSAAFLMGELSNPPSGSSPLAQTGSR